MLDKLYLIENPDSLVDWPELGCGYQFCTRLYPESRRSKHLIVFNQLIGIDLDGYDSLRRGDKESHQTLQEISRKIDYLNFSIYSEEITRAINDIVENILFETAEVVAVEIQNDEQIYRNFIKRSAQEIRESATEQATAGPSARPGSLHGSPPFAGQTQPGDQFIRYSAFRNDFRINSDWGLVAGSYATSKRDAQAVSSALHARGRYALPNPVPPVHIFEINPPPGINLQYGTVESLHGQSGGGVEVEFTDPLPAGSVVYRGTQSIW